MRTGHDWFRRHSVVIQSSALANHRLLLERHFAIAAIAAAKALFAKMIAAGVLGAAFADARRLFFTDTAGKRHYPSSLLGGRRARGAVGRLRQVSAAALRFFIDDLELFLFIGR